MGSKRWILNHREIQFFFLFLYFFAFSAFNLGTGFDWFFVRGSFIVLVLVVLLFNRELVLNGHFAWYLIFWAFYCLSALWASNKSDTFRYLESEFIQIIGLAVCLPTMIKSKKDLDLTINLIILALLGTVLRLFIMTPFSTWGTERLGEAIGSNSNGLGMMLAFGSVLSLYLLWETIRADGKRKIIKIVFYAFMLVLLAGVSLFTGSRKTIIIIVGGLALYLILLTRDWKILIRILIVGAIVAVFLYFIFTNETLYSVLGRRLVAMLQTFTGQGTANASMVERSYYRSEAMQLFTQHPVFGYGGNNFMTYMREIGYNHVAYSHNNYTELLSTLGMIGFGIYYFYWLLTSGRLALRYFKEGNNQYLLFMVIILVQFVLDYWCVSYISVFTQVLFILAGISIQVDRQPADTKLIYDIRENRKFHEQGW